MLILQVFDYNSSSVVDDVVKAVKATGSTFAGVYDAISLEDQTYNLTIPVVEKLGGVLATVLPTPKNLPDNVKSGSVFAINKVTHPIWADFVTPALE